MECEEYSPSNTPQGAFIRTGLGFVCMKKRLLLVGLVAAVGVAAVTILVRAHPGAPAGIAAANGRLEATEIDIATKPAGRVADILVREGDTVAAGAVLARMDSKVLDAEAQAAGADLSRAREAYRLAVTTLAERETRAQLAQSDLDRSLRLRQSQVVSEQQIDRDRTAAQLARTACEAAAAERDVAQASVDAARARLAAVEAELGEAVLRTPRSGQVLYRLAEPGEVLGAGGRVATILDLSDLSMTIFLPTRAAGQTRIGSEARIVLDAFPDRPMTARVTFVAPEAQFTPKEVETQEERERLMFRVKLGVVGPVDPQWKPGMPGMGYVRLDEHARWPSPP